MKLTSRDKRSVTFGAGGLQVPFNPGSQDPTSQRGVGSKPEPVHTDNFSDEKSWGISVIKAPADDITPSPFNRGLPRADSIDPFHVENLAEQISSQGQKQPCDVVTSRRWKEVYGEDVPTRYVLVTGHHRLEALKQINAHVLIAVRDDDYLKAREDLHARQFGENSGLPHTRSQKILTIAAFYDDAVVTSGTVKGSHKEVTRKAQQALGIALTGAQISKNVSAAQALKTDTRLQRLHDEGKVSRTRLEEIGRIKDHELRTKTAQEAADEAVKPQPQTIPPVHDVAAWTRRLRKTFGPLDDQDDIDRTAAAIAAGAGDPETLHRIAEAIAAQARRINDRAASAENA